MVSLLLRGYFWESSIIYPNRRCFYSCWLLFYDSCHKLISMSPFHSISDTMRNCSYVCHDFLFPLLPALFVHSYVYVTMDSKEFWEIFTGTFYYFFSDNSLLNTDFIFLVNINSAVENPPGSFGFGVTPYTLKNR